MKSASASAAPGAPAPEPAVDSAVTAGTGAGPSLVRSAALVGFWTLISRILGLVRFRLMAHYFGASFVADAFNFAFVFPNLTRRLFGEGLLSKVFIPVFAGQLAKGEKDAANRTASVLICRLTYWLSLGCIALIVLLGVVRLVLPLGEKDLLQVQLIQWLLPYLVVINLAAIFMGILNSLGHFNVPAFAPVLLNVAVIAVCNQYVLPAFGETDTQRIWLVAYAVLAAGVLQLLVQIPPAFARGFRFLPGFSTDDPGYRDVSSGFAPVAGLMAIFQLNVMLDNIMAQFLVPGDGAVTHLNMGTSIYQLAWSIVGLAMSTAALPALATYWAQQKTGDFERTLRRSLRLTVFLTLPATFGLFLLSDEIVRLLYGTGKFLLNDAEPVRRTAGVAAFAGLGLVFFSINSILASALYAMKDMRTPTVTAAKSVGINIVLNLILVWPLQESGIALASAISTAWQSWVLFRAVRIRLQDAPNAKSADVDWSAQGKFLFLFGAVVVGSLIAGGVAFTVLSKLAAQKYWTGRLELLNESFAPFFGAVFASLFPLSHFMRSYFAKRLADKPQDPNPGEHRYGIREEHWNEELRTQYSLYATVLSSFVVGFAVWAVRDSLPPEGHVWQTVQRALVPIAGGVVIYYMAITSMHAPEWFELRDAISRKWKRKDSA